MDDWIQCLEEHSQQNSRPGQGCDSALVALASSPRSQVALAVMLDNGGLETRALSTSTTVAFSQLLSHDCDNQLDKPG